MSLLSMTASNSCTNLHILQFFWQVHYTVDYSLQSQSTLYSYYCIVCLSVHHTCDLYTYYNSTAVGWSEMIFGRDMHVAWGNTALNVGPGTIYEKRWFGARIPGHNLHCKLMPHHHHHCDAAYCKMTRAIVTTQNNYELINTQEFLYATLYHWWTTRTSGFVCWRTACELAFFLQTHPFLSTSHSQVMFSETKKVQNSNVADLKRHILYRKWGYSD